MAPFRSLFKQMPALRLGRVSLGDLIVAMLVGLCILLAANLFWVIVTPQGSVGDWKARTPLTLSASARSALFASSDPFARVGAQPAGNLTVTSLDLTLFGTRMNEFSGSGSAILAGADGIQQSYTVGQEIMPGVVLAAVAFDHVMLSRGGVKEPLYIDQSVPAETVGQNAAAPASPAAASDGSAEVKLNAATLRDAVNVTPRNEGGRVTGLILGAKDDGAMLRNAGLAQGDIVVAINGRPVGSVADIVAQFRPGAKLTLEVERGSQKIPVGLNLE